MYGQVPNKRKGDIIMSNNKETRPVKSISPFLLEKKEMTLDEFVNSVKSLLSKSGGSGTLDTGYQWVADQIVSPYKGYALNISKGYTISGIENKNTASQLVVDALSKAGIQIITLPAQAMFYYLKLEEG